MQLNSPQIVIDEDTKEQLRPLWFASATVLLLSLFRLILFFDEEVQAACEQYLHLPLANAIVNGLFFWLLGTLLVAYRHWHRAVGRELELERVVSSINPDVLIVVQPDRTISSCNTAVRSMFGMDPEAVIGKKTDILYGDRRTDKTRPEIRECLDSIGFHVGYATATRQDGSTFPLEIVTGSLRGRPGAVVLIRDITQLRQAQEQLLAAKEEAEAATRAKSEALVLLESNYEKLRELEAMRDQLTHMIVHDMKAPIAAIHGYLGMIEASAGDALPENSRRQLAESSQISVRLREMILTLLDIGRLESGELPLSLSDCDMIALARDASRMLGSSVATEKIRIEASDATVSARCDAHIIRRVLVNLMDNAVKYSPLAEPVVVDISQGDGRVRVAVKDKGPGIPPEHHDRIFELFGQLQAKEFSTGIGLSFCRMATEAHGGTMRLESAPDTGSTFTMDIPATGPAE